MRDPFAWIPGDGRDAWFERAGVSLAKPIGWQGRAALLALMLGMLAAIPLSVAAALAGLHLAWTMVVLVLGFVAVPVWFLFAARGRVRVTSSVDARGTV